MSNINELLSSLELSEDAANKIRETIETNYVGRAIAHEDKEIQSRIVGKTLGSFETKLNRNLKLIDPDLIKPEEIKELGFDKALDVSFERLTQRVNDLQTKAKAAGSSNPELKREYEEIKTKYEQLNADYPQVLKQKQTLEEQLAQKDNEFRSFQTNLLISQKREEALKKVQFTDDLPEAAKNYAVKGFLDAVNSRYEVQLSDEDESGLRIVDKSTGQRVAQDNRFLSLDEVYALEAKKAGLLKLSTGGDSNKKESFKFERKKDGNNSSTNALGYQRKS